MSGIYRDLHGKGLEAVSAAMNPNPQVPQFVQRFNAAFPIGTAENEKAREFMQISLMTQAYVPWLALIDRAGMIRHQYFGNDAAFSDGGVSFRMNLEKLLAERAPAAVKTPPKKAAAKKG